MLFQKCQKKLFVIMILKKKKKDDFFKVNPAKTVEEAETKVGVWGEITSGAG